MIITVASGKGGTGKTFISVNLALYISDYMLRRCSLLDCDVENPNDKLYFRGAAYYSEGVFAGYPVFDPAKCTGCGECVSACAFNALSLSGRQLLIFNELCHSCSACWTLCPAKAILPSKRAIGRLFSETGSAGLLRFIYGEMNALEVLSPMIIRDVKKRIDPAGINILDAPPGATCPFVTTVSGSDYCILAAETTPFGLYDLSLAVTALNALNIRHGVIINKADGAYKEIHNYCDKNGIEVLLEIPLERDIAVYCSMGIPVVKDTKYRGYFQTLAEKLMSKEGEFKGV